MIYVKGNSALKSESDRSLNSFRSDLEEKVNTLNIETVRLTKKVLSFSEKVGYLGNVIEVEREHLKEDLKKVGDDLTTKGQKGDWQSTVDTIEEILNQEKDNLEKTNEDIREKSKCLTQCQACVGGDSYCSSIDTCTAAFCKSCYSQQGGCIGICDSGQGSVCSAFYNPETVQCVNEYYCTGDYNSACDHCYTVTFSTCKEEQNTCHNCVSGGNSCSSCYTVAFSSCSNCQNNVGTCSNCYGGSYRACGEGQVNPCGRDYQDIFCNSNIDPQCSTEFTPPSDCGAIWKATCNRAYESCIQDYYYCTKSDIICRSGQGKCIGYNPTTGSCNKDYAETCGRNIGSGTSCATNYDSDSCQSSYQKTCSSSNESVYCDKDYGKNCDRQNTVCEKSYNSGNTVCSGGYKSDPYGEVNCKSSYTGASGWETCMEDFDGHACKAGYRDLDGVVCQSGYVPGDPPGCQSGYSKGGVTCDDCYGTAYGCGGCYDVAYCSKCNTNQTSCTSCVKGQTTCNGCVSGQEVPDDTGCNGCYGSCWSDYVLDDWCLQGWDPNAVPPCTACVFVQGCQSCQTSQSCSQGCGSSDCGSSNCGSSNCGSSNCGTRNCGTANCSNCGTANCSNCGTSESCNSCEGGCHTCVAPYIACGNDYGCTPLHCASGVK